MFFPQGQQEYLVDDETSLMLPAELSQITSKDAAHFYDKVKWDLHTVSFGRRAPPQGRRSLTPTFVQPHVEETFNESALLTEDSMARYVRVEAGAKKYGGCTLEQKWD